MYVMHVRWFFMVLRLCVNEHQLNDSSVRVCIVICVSIDYFRTLFFLRKNSYSYFAHTTIQYKQNSLFSCDKSSSFSTSIIRHMKKQQNLD
jgi:hypothetical protein